MLSTGIKLYSPTPTIGLDRIITRALFSSSFLWVIDCSAKFVSSNRGRTGEEIIMVKVVKMQTRIITRLIFNCLLNSFLSELTSQSLFLFLLGNCCFINLRKTTITSKNQRIITVLLKLRISAMDPKRRANVFNSIFVLFFFVSKKLYINVSEHSINPASTFGWGNVPYGRRSSWPFMEALAIPGVADENFLSPK